MATKLLLLTYNDVVGATAPNGDSAPSADGNSRTWYGLNLGDTNGSAASSFSMSTASGPVNPIDYTTFGDMYLWVSRPISADVTISGTISVNLWAYESNMSANATVGMRVLRLQPDGTMTEIGRNNFGTELGTSSAAKAFNITPTSTALTRGDRIVLSPFCDDATGLNMGSGYYVYVRYRGAAGADGDSYVSFAETITFESAAAQTTLYLTTTNLGIGTNGKEMWTSRGSGSTNCDSTSFSAWSAAAQIAAGGTVIEWYTKALTAVTLQGAFTVNLRGLLSSFSGYAPLLRAEIAVTDGSGGSVTSYGWSGAASKLTTSDTAYQFWIAGAPISVANGQRIRLRVFIDDPSGSGSGGYAQINSGAARFTYAGTSAGAAGDSWIQSPVALTVYAPAGQIAPSTIASAESVGSPALEKYFATKWYLTWGDTDLPHIGLTDNVHLDEEVLLMRPSKRGELSQMIVTPTVAGPTSGVQITDTTRASATSYRSQWNNPVKLSDGTMYWVDGYKIMRRNTSGHVSIAAGWVEYDSHNGYLPETGVYEGFGADAMLDYPPGGFFVDNAEEFIWIADGDYIRKYEIATGELTNVVDFNALMGDPLMALAGICLDSTETYVYVSDRLFGCIYRYDIANNTGVLIAGNHGSGFVSYVGEGTGSAAVLGYVPALCISADDSLLYFASGFTMNGISIPSRFYIRSCTPVPNAGVTSFIAGNDSSGWADGTGAAAHMCQIASMVIDSNGDLYFGDGEFYYSGHTYNSYCHRLRKCVPSTGVVSSIAGSGAQSDYDGTGTGAGFWFPMNVGMERGTTSPIYVVSTRGHTIRQVTSGGVSTRMHGDTTGGYNAVPYWNSISDGDGPTCWMTDELAGVTIPSSTQVAAHLFCRESNSLANVAWRLKLERCDSAGVVISTIVDGTSTVELPTTMGAVDFTLSTPSQVTLSDGDRIKATLFLDDDDSGNMASGYTATLQFNGSAAQSADSFIGFPTLVVSPRTKTWYSPFYLTNTTATVTADTYSTTNKRVADTTPGSSATEKTTSPGTQLGHPGNSVMAGRVGAQYSSSSPYGWWTAPLSAVTFYRGDQIRCKFWAKQGGDYRMSIGCRVTLVSATGVRKAHVAYGHTEYAMGTVKDLHDFIIVVESTVAVADGDRLLISPLLQESLAVAPRGSGGGIVVNGNWTFYYNGADDSSQANSQIMFDKTVSLSSGTQTVGALALLTSTSAIYAPTVVRMLQFVTLGLIDGGAAIYAPSLNITGEPQDIGPLALLTSTAEIYAAVPALASPMQPIGPLALLTSTPAIYSLAVSTSALVELGLIDAGAAIYAPELVMIANLQLGLIESTPAVYMLSAFKMTEDDLTRYADNAGDGRYIGEAMAIRVWTGVFSATPDADSLSDSPIYSGQSAQVFANPNSPPQWDYESVTAPALDYPVYPGKSDAIHVFGEQHYVTPHDPVPACECDPDWDSGSEVSGMFDHFFRSLTGTWGSASYERDNIHSVWAIHNWAGTYGLDVTGSFNGEGSLYPYQNGGYLGMRAAPLVDPETDEFIPYSVPWTNMGNHFTMRIHLRGINTTQLHDIYFGIMDGEDGDWAWQEYFEVAWNAGGNPNWNDWIIVWEVNAKQWSRGKYWRPLMEPEPTNWQVFRWADPEDSLFDTDWHLFIIALYPGVHVDYITYAYEGMDCVECEDPDNPGVQIPPFTPGYMPIFRRQIGDPTTTLDSYICTMSSGAMVLDWHTRGAIQVWGGDLVAHCGRSVASILGSGTNLGDLRTAWAYYGQSLSVRSGQTWNDLMNCLAEGRAVVLQGDYGVFTLAERCQDNFVDNHAISVYPYQQSGRLLVGDPICHDFKGFLETSLQEYAETLGAAVYGSHNPQPILFAVSRPWTP